MTRTIGPSRGVLQYPPGPGVFHHARIAPPAGLMSCVQHFWIVQWDLQGSAPQVRETLPHPNVHLVIDAQGAHIHGVHLGRFEAILEGRGGVVGVKFRPGGFRPFLRRSVSTLRNRTITLEQVFGQRAASLAADVFSRADDEGMTEAVSDFLAAHLPPPDSTVERVASIVDAIEADRNLVTVEQLLARWRVAKRPLQRLFNEYVGVGPKWVINRYRLHEALERLHAGAPVDWSQLALELGYFDQSHFIRDFRSLVGRSPAQYVRALRDDKQ